MTASPFNILNFAKLGSNAYSFYDGPEESVPVWVLDPVYELDIRRGGLFDNFSFSLNHGVYSSKSYDGGYIIVRGDAVKDIDELMSAPWCLRGVRRGKGDHSHEWVDFYAIFDNPDDKAIFDLMGYFD